MKTWGLSPKFSFLSNLRGEYYAPIARAIALAIFISEQQEKFSPILTDAPFYRGDEII
jgi:hypothetical protein